GSRPADPAGGALAGGMGRHDDNDE
ncbi:MAG: hypothetical protein AVDCRST_MAG88-1083, partial [uncultured Thermomicrobiales bacterium]